MSETVDLQLARVITGRPRIESRHTPTAQLLECATTHRVDLLLAARLVADGTIAPDVDRDPMREALRCAAASELARCAAVSRVTKACAAVGLHPILLKGDAIAPLLYRSSHLRPRSDTDLLIRAGEIVRAEATLAAHGYTRAQESTGTLTTFQSHWSRSSPTASDHVVDLHWRLFNAEPFARVLETDEIIAASIPVPTLGPAARAPSFEHQLIVTAVHRVAHHYDRLDLLWLYDIHLLVHALGPERLAAAGRLATARSVGPILARGLLRAAAAFGTPVDESWLRALGAAPLDPRSRVFLDGQPRQVQVLGANLAALNRWRPRLRLLQEHLFPSTAYMRSLYAGWPGPLLPVAYLHRIVRGAPKWFRRTSAAHH